MQGERKLQILPSLAKSWLTQKSQVVSDTRFLLVARSAQPIRLSQQKRQEEHWFSHSPPRPREYVQIYQLINDGNTPLKLVQLSATRWFSVHDCCVHVLDQWDELKFHFQLSKDRQQCYDAEVLYQVYCNPVNKLYLQFLTRVLQEFARIIKLLQLESGGNAFKMLDCLQAFFDTLISRVLLSQRIPVSDTKLLEVNLSDTASHLLLCAANFSAMFTIAVGDAKLDKAVEETIKSRC
ncbi:hypothetical protein KIL84_012771 [Mauremys mutica]|uniref:Uncharacterized protein n=1 Tax=Mauremys mutica TaxID=74926 RepID=A0A9D4B8X2_9SAUR|nr:hypothetical protein KIL84_012771 [Mauremys mutica]